MSSFKQTRVTTSSTESEIEAIFELTKEVLWWRMFLDEIGFPQTESSTIYNDNMSTIHMLSTPLKNDKKAKHYILRINFVKDNVTDTKEVALEYVPTAQNFADILTKSPTAALFIPLCQRMLEGAQQSH